MPPPPKHVAVIGAGISGIVAAAHLSKEGISATVFERSNAAGGIWVYDERKPLEPDYSPVVNSRADSIDTDTTSQDLQRLVHAPPGPCYVGLKNNVSTRLLETTLNSFPPGTGDYVTHDVLKDYIQTTALKTGVDKVIHYNTEVTKVTKSGNSWIVDTVTLHTNYFGAITRASTTSRFDAVVVASGHYHAPKVPNTPGLAEWKRLWPDRVQHSKGYRSPAPAQGKNFLLVGGSVSSTDIARELGPLANKIYQSQRNGAFDLSANLLPSNGYRVDEVASYDTYPDQESSSLAPSEPIPYTVTLKSGQKLCDIHHVILCTGYYLTLPFLPDYQSSETPVEQASDDILVTDGTQFHNLHKDIFYINDPSLVFIGVPFFTATFTLFEFQAMVVAKVLSGEAKLPNKEAMQLEYNERVRSKGYGKAFHSLRDQEAEYVDELLAWVNHDLEEGRREKLVGHTDKWHAAKQEQVERIKALFAAPSNVKRLEVTCS